MQSIKVLQIRLSSQEPKYPIAANLKNETWEMPSKSSGQAKLSVPTTPYLSPSIYSVTSQEPGSMKKQLPLEFLYQIFSLIIAVLLVHAIYVSIVRPNASAVLEQQALLINQEPDYVPERNSYVIIQ
ncbi:uncharacterized protein METZ01_LOCUS294962, partial [marine metagenome]